MSRTREVSGNSRQELNLLRAVPVLVIVRPLILQVPRSPKCLQCWKATELARKRNPWKGKKRSRGEGVSDPKPVTPRQRVREFLNESLTESNSKLFRQPCRGSSYACCLIYTHVYTVHTACKFGFA